MEGKITSEGTERTLGREAQKNNILAARAVADILKTTLGPKGMDKMLVDRSGEITVTNDGVTILDEMEIEHPAAKMVVDISRTQEREVGDGTTTVALLVGKLLERAEALLDKKIHPSIIAEAYRISAEKCERFLEEIAVEIESKEVLKQIAKTAMTGKGAEGNKEKLASIIVEGVDQIARGSDVSMEDIKIERISGGKTSDSELVNGMVLNKTRVNKEMPRDIEDARILLVDFALEIRNPELQTQISISSPEQLESFIESEEMYLKTMVGKIRDVGANVVFCMKGIDDTAQYYLAKSGILAFRRVSKTDLEKISRATSARIISNLNEISEDELGRAGKVSEIEEGVESLVYIRDCFNPRAVTLVLRSGSEHLGAEVERAVRDGLGDVISAVRVRKVVAGGGACEAELVRRLREFARSLGGRIQLGVEEFSNALESIPETLAENAGLDPIDIITAIRQMHNQGFERVGLNLFSGRVEDTLEAGIIEPLKVKTQAISSSSELASMILRIDDVLVSSKDSEKDKFNQVKEFD